MEGYVWWIWRVEVVRGPGENLFLVLNPRARQPGSPFARLPNFDLIYGYRDKQVLPFLDKDFFLLQNWESYRHCSCVISGIISMNNNYENIPIKSSVLAWKGK